LQNTRSVLIDLVCAAILQALHSTLTRQLVKVKRSKKKRSVFTSVLGWADELCRDVLLSSPMSEYVHVVTIPYSKGEHALPACQQLWKVETKPSTTEEPHGFKELHEIMHIRNGDLRKRVRRGDARVTVSKFDVDNWGYHGEFEKQYGQLEGCWRYNGFEKPPPSTEFSARLVVFVAGWLH
jgi:hypothetical protein